MYTPSPVDEGVWERSEPPSRAWAEHRPDMHFGIRPTLKATERSFLHLLSSSVFPCYLGARPRFGAIAIGAR